MTELVYPVDRLATIDARLARIEVALSSLSRERSAGSVYIVSDGAGRYKIGKSHDPAERVRGIVTSNLTARLVLTIETDNRHALEKALHQRYRRAGRFLGGEWYALAQSDIDALGALPSPLFEEELAKVKALSCEMHTPVLASAKNEGEHPTADRSAQLVYSTEAARAWALFRDGADIAQIVKALRGIDAGRGGGAYQQAARDVQAMMRQALAGRLNAKDEEKHPTADRAAWLACSTQEAGIVAGFLAGQSASDLAAGLAGRRGGRAYQNAARRVADALRRALETTP